MSSSLPEKDWESILQLDCDELGPQLPVYVSAAEPSRADPCEVMIITRQTRSNMVIYHTKGLYPIWPETTDTPGTSVLHVWDLDSDDHDSTFYRNKIVKSWAYSLGHYGARKFTTPLLRDTESGTPVLCQEEHWHCNGVRTCAMYIPEKEAESHIYTTNELLRNQHSYARSPKTHAEILVENTIAFYHMLINEGCGCPTDKVTPQHSFSDLEWDIKCDEDRKRKLRQRGHKMPSNLCEGKIQWYTAETGETFVKCEHHCSSDKAHRCHSVDRYDQVYLRALFSKDWATLDHIENNAAAAGYGPRTSCQYHTNPSTVHPFCPNDHRDLKTGRITDFPLDQSPTCKSQFRLIVPIDLVSCPRILLLCSGAHHHAIPTPTSAPPMELSTLRTLLLRTGENLSSMTARGAMRDPIINRLLSLILPHITEPSLGDLHISFYNRSYLGRMIQKTKDEVFPDGTGWDGLLTYERQQNATMPPENHYLRRMFDDGENKFMICMLPDQSWCLQQALEVIIDTSFKRIHGAWKEFTIDGWDSRLNTSITYATVMVLHETAEIHRQFLNIIDEIVLKDTNSHLRFKHIHFDDGIADSRYVNKEIIVADAHRGQALGVGLYLQNVTSALYVSIKATCHDIGAAAVHDLNWESRLALSPYGHLKSIYRLCRVHGFQNINELKLPPDVTSAMKSLWCLKHPNWDAALAIIRGHPKGHKWLEEKISSGFALSGMCCEMSNISELAWAASRDNSNVGEAAHMDTYREGTFLSPLVAMLRGRRLALNKYKARQATSTAGIREGDHTGEARERATLTARRGSKLSKFNRVDNGIQELNQRVQSLYTERIGEESKLTMSKDALAALLPTLASSSRHGQISWEIKRIEGKIRSIQSKIDQGISRLSNTEAKGSRMIKIWKILCSSGHSHSSTGINIQGSTGGSSHALRPHIFTMPQLLQDPNPNPGTPLGNDTHAYTLATPSTFLLDNHFCGSARITPDTDVQSTAPNPNPGTPLGNNTHAYTPAASSTFLLDDHFHGSARITPNADVQSTAPQLSSLNHGSNGYSYPGHDDLSQYAYEVGLIPGNANATSNAVVHPFSTTLHQFSYQDMDFHSSTTPQLQPWSLTDQSTQYMPQNDYPHISPRSQTGAHGSVMLGMDSHVPSGSQEPEHFGHDYIGRNLSVSSYEHPGGAMSLSSMNIDISTSSGVQDYPRSFSNSSYDCGIDTPQNPLPVMANSDFNVFGNSSAPTWSPPYGRLNREPDLASIHSTSSDLQNTPHFKESHGSANIRTREQFGTCIQLTMNGNSPRTLQSVISSEETSRASITCPYPSGTAPSRIPHGGR
ncbi:hypothetical protein BS47DRAFT_1444915 [Hydnum rufescens UP504]|uniref:Uncharacterized protein n=1 Tax=Hydnum rufescens UP504 TaxID=1448309 RepID=A0A9P6ADN9_9AGAM|nr:hypothetical protein BS47DRAFT_1444915 [Hydnum rufescens UP504]